MHTDTTIAPARPVRSLMSHLIAYLVALGRHHREAQQLSHLRGLDDHILKDIGVTRNEAHIAKPQPLRHFLRQR